MIHKTLWIEKMDIKNKYILSLTLFFLIIAFAISIFITIDNNIMRYDELSSFKEYCDYIGVFCIPFYSFLVLYIISILFNNKIFHLFMNIISTVIAFVFIVVFGILYILLTPYATSDNCTPRIEEYKRCMKELEPNRIGYRFEHFPKEIPPNSEAYLRFEGENDIYYLSLTADNNYIQQILQEYKDKIDKKIKDKIYIKKHSFDIKQIMNLENPSDYDIYILKNERNDKYYLSGFVISEKYNTIIFFYSTP